MLNQRGKKKKKLEQSRGHLVKNQGKHPRTEASNSPVFKREHIYAFDRIVECERCARLLKIVLSNLDMGLGCLCDMIYEWYFEMRIRKWGFRDLFRLSWVNDYFIQRLQVRQGLVYSCRSLQGGWLPNHPSSGVRGARHTVLTTSYSFLKTSGVDISSMSASWEIRVYQHPRDTLS